MYRNQEDAIIRSPETHLDESRGAPEPHNARHMRRYGMDTGGIPWQYLGMADRKQFLNVPTADPDLVRLLLESRNRTVTEQELQEQRVSFAFGNAPASASERITKDSVRAASTRIRLL
jgi:hypothetical protein